MWQCWQLWPYQHPRDIRLQGLESMFYYGHRKLQNETNNLYRKLYLSKGSRKSSISKGHRQFLKEVVNYYKGTHTCLYKIIIL